LAGGGVTLVVGDVAVPGGSGSFLTRTVPQTTQIAPVVAVGKPTSVMVGRRLRKRPPILEDMPT
jgi:hypothetical protein